MSPCAMNSGLYDTSQPRQSGSSDAATRSHHVGLTVHETTMCLPSVAARLWRAAAAHLHDASYAWAPPEEGVATMM